jgi:hypothetical protein
MLRAVFLTYLAFGFAAFAEPLSPPTRPATQKSPPKQIVKTLKGSVRFAVPADWTESSRSEDGKTIGFSSPDEVASVSVQIVPQDYPLPQKSVAFHEKVKATLIKNIKAAMENQGQDITYGPRSETDDRFFQRIHTRAKQGDDTLDTLHLFRGAGLDLLVVNSIVKTDDPKLADKYHTMAEDISLSITVGSAEKEKK